MEQPERDLVKRLLPYLGTYPVIFDVGSNQGEWSDLVIDYAHELHLFEPNEIFLHYTMVRYCERTNVRYNKEAACEKSGNHVDFFYFIQGNNGLSSLYKNHKWDDLPRLETKVPTVRLDEYCGENKIAEVDLIKIDVEGAEYDVINGCKKLFEKRRVRFIQIEYSEHYQVPGYTMNQIIDFINPFGYSIFNLNLERIDNFEEDYREENFIIAMSDFAENWNQVFIENTRGQMYDDVLEIGCFDGLTTKYICENMLNPGGKITCVDPLEDVYLTDDLSEEDEKINKDLSQFKGQYDRFIRNTKGLPVDLIRKRSQDAYDELVDRRFDFIYVDGDHREPALYNDAVKCWKMIAERFHSRILFDDYEGYHEQTTRALNRFLDDTAGVKIVFKNYQLMIRNL